MIDGDYIVVIVIIFAISVGIFLLIRSLILWYYRINESIENQKSVISQNKKIIGLLEEINENIQEGILFQIKCQKKSNNVTKKSKANTTDNEEIDE